MIYNYQLSSEWSWITDPDPDDLKGTLPKVSVIQYTSKGIEKTENKANGSFAFLCQTHRFQNKAT